MHLIFGYIQQFHHFQYIFSSSAADLSEGLVAISIDDSGSDANNATTSDEPKKEEPLLPVKMCYEWKDITQEFFEAVKGKRSHPRHFVAVIDVDFVSC